MAKPSRPKLPRPPSHLRQDGRELWKRVVAEYDLAADALAVLELTCQAHDRYGDARRTLDSEGTTFTDRFKQVKPHPAILIERDSRQAVLRGIKQLGLDLEPLNARPGRPAGR